MKDEKEKIEEKIFFLPFFFSLLSSFQHSFSYLFVIHQEDSCKFYFWSHIKIALLIYQREREREKIWILLISWLIMMLNFWTAKKWIIILFPMFLILFSFQLTHRVIGWTKEKSFRFYHICVHNNLLFNNRSVIRKKQDKHILIEFNTKH